ncbi:MAG: dihydrodipicolinate synthase family protein, partial [FCB group bacterium]|nr:dihydrodipicolinate synthase family protein [FCB group bacterium]
MPIPMPPAEVVDLLRAGLVIPAHPLALTVNRRFDAQHQRALTRYYLAAGAGGLAVGVHTTQFAIRDPKVALFEPVIELAGDTIDDYTAQTGRTIVKIGGIVGQTQQAVREAMLLRNHDYHVGLLSLAAMRDVSIDKLIEHCHAVSQIIPLMGFYLQPAVGGRPLPVEFWRRFAQIENVVAIKIAPFNRYQTLDVVRGVAEAHRADTIALYTGNDDNILIDLLTQYRIRTGAGDVSLRMAGGLLGHWACWTRKAVRQFDECRRLAAEHGSVPEPIMMLSNEITDANSAFFDVRNSFRGCIAGIHEVLRRQRLLAGRWCLDPDEDLSPGQMEEINRRS